MSHVFAELNIDELSEYVRVTVERVEATLKTCLSGETNENDYFCRSAASIRAYEIYRLVVYFNIELHPDFAIKIGELMTIQAFK